MTYNIDNFEIVKCELTIALDDLLEFAEDRDLTVTQKKGGKIEVCGISEGFDFEGIKGERDIIVISRLETWGVGSGSGWDDFESLLKLANGTLKAVLTWEGGELERLEVSNNKISRSFPEYKKMLFPEEFTNESAETY